MDRMKIASIILASVVGSALFVCTDNPAGSKDHAPVHQPAYDGLYGKLVDGNGDPASGASVKAIGTGTAALNKATVSKAALSSDTDSVVTDDSGYYSFESLDAGTYNLQGDYDNGSLVVLITGIEYDSTGAIREVRTDTLRAPGQIAGIVNTTTEDNSGVLCYIPGTSFLAMTDDAGAFLLSNIPEGSYRVTYRKAQLRSVSDTGIEVRTSEKTVLSTIRMEADPAYPPPVPGGLRIAYDTLSGCALLIWSHVSVEDLAGYVVFRNDTESQFPERINDQPATDTVYFDTIFSDLADTTDRVLAYRLKAQDEEANLSMVYSKAVVIDAPSPTKVWTFISLRLLNTVNDTASINDTVAVIASWKNETRKNVRVEWFVNADDSLVKTVDDTAFTGEDTLRRWWSDASVKTVYVSVTDEGGVVWRDSVSVPIVQDIPAVDAGNDTTALAADTVPLHGAAAQRFGEIEKWEWRIGSGSWSETGGPDTFVVIPPMKTEIACSLAVTDDDGNRGADEVMIRFIPRIKNVSAGFENSIVLMEDGTVFGFGQPGGLGIAAMVNQYSPIETMNDIQMIETWGHSLMVKTDGTLWGYGNCSSGELGDLTGEYRTTPIRIFDNGMDDLKNISAGGGVSWMLKPDNTLWGCGYNYDGLIGDTSIQMHKTPVQIMGDAKSMSAGSFFGLILKTDNTLWACGRYYDGRLFNGALTIQPTSEPVKVLDDVKDMAVGERHCLILKSDNTLWFCGCMWLDEETTPRQILYETPIQIMSDVQSISTHGRHSLVLKTDGTLWAFGVNKYGGLGDGTYFDRENPVQIMNEVRSMSAGLDHSLILKRDNTLWGCGANYSGQLGDGTNINRPEPVRIILPFE